VQRLVAGIVVRWDDPKMRCLGPVLSCVKVVLVLVHAD
jgi:hypothetical protein